MIRVVVSKSSWRCPSIAARIASKGDLSHGGSSPPIDRKRRFGRLSPPTAKRPPRLGRYPSSQNSEGLAAIYPANRPGSSTACRARTGPRVTSRRGSGGPDRTDSPARPAGSTLLSGNGGTWGRRRTSRRISSRSVVKSLDRVAVHDVVIAPERHPDEDHIRDEMIFNQAAKDGPDEVDIPLSIQQVDRGKLLRGPVGAVTEIL